MEGRADAIGGPATIPGASFTGLAIGNSSIGRPNLRRRSEQRQHLRLQQQLAKQRALSRTRTLRRFQRVTLRSTSRTSDGTLYVTYANQSTGGGIVDEFSTDGKFIKTLINDTSGLWLNAPWGLALAPKSFGLFGGDLLVGNNNAGSNNLTEINAFNPSTGTFAGTLTLSNGQPFSEPDLWAIELRQRRRRRFAGHPLLHRRPGYPNGRPFRHICRFPSRARPSWD